MLLDVRTYRCKPGTIKAHLKLYSEKGKPAQSRHAIQTNTLIYWYTRMQTTEKRKELPCGLMKIGLIIPKKAQNLAL